MVPLPALRLQGRILRQKYSALTANCCRKARRNGRRRQMPKLLLLLETQISLLLPQRAPARAKARREALTRPTNNVTTAGSGGTSLLIAQIRLPLRPMLSVNGANITKLWCITLLLNASEIPILARARAVLPARARANLLLDTLLLTGHDTHPRVLEVRVKALSGVMAEDLQHLLGTPTISMQISMIKWVTTPMASFPTALIRSIECLDASTKSRSLQFITRFL